MIDEEVFAGFVKYAEGHTVMLFTAIEALESSAHCEMACFVGEEEILSFVCFPIDD